MDIEQSDLEAFRLLAEKYKLYSPSYLKKFLTRAVPLEQIGRDH